MQKLTGVYLCIRHKCWTCKCTLTCMRLYMKPEEAHTQTCTYWSAWKNSQLSSWPSASLCSSAFLLIKPCLSTVLLFSSYPFPSSFSSLLLSYLVLSLLTAPTIFFCLSTDCQFEISGWDGIIRSSQVDEEERVKPGDALDCIWTIRAPPQSKVSNSGKIALHSMYKKLPGVCAWLFPWI